MVVVGGHFDNDAVRVVVVDVVEFVVLVVVLPVVFVVDLLVGEAMQIGAETFGIAEGSHDVVDKARLHVAKTRGVDGIRSKIVEMVAA